MFAALIHLGFATWKCPLPEGRQQLALWQPWKEKETEREYVCPYQGRYTKQRLSIWEIKGCELGLSLQVSLKQQRFWSNTMNLLSHWLFFFKIFCSTFEIFLHTPSDHLQRCVHWSQTCAPLGHPTPVHTCTALTELSHYKKKTWSWREHMGENMQRIGKGKWGIDMAIFYGIFKNNFKNLNDWSPIIFQIWILFHYF